MSYQSIAKKVCNARHLAVSHFILVPYDIDKITFGFTIVGHVGCFANSGCIEFRAFYCKNLMTGRYANYFSK